MCWNSEVSMAMTGIGAAAAVVTYRRKDPAAIWLTLGYFSCMEALQVAGYAVLDQCGTPENRAVTMASYLHIVFQPFLINAFAMELVPQATKKRTRKWVYAFCGLSAAVMLAQLVPWQFAGECLPGSPLCASTLCTVSGNWHIAWDIPYSGLLLPFEDAVGIHAGFPTYMVAAFVLPLVYGAWRFAVMHAAVGPTLAWALTDNPNEMPAVWCLFSIFILFLGLSLRVRRRFTTMHWWGQHRVEV